MLKKSLVVLALMAGVICSAVAESKRDTIPPFIGVSYIPSRSWFVHHITTNDGDFLKYNFRGTSMSSYEGSFGIKSIGMRFGVSAEVDDNIIGKVQRYGGYLGLKGFWLKLQGGSVAGSVNWLGELPPGFSDYYSFNNKTFSIELLRNFTKKRYIDGKWQVSEFESQYGFFWGIGYQTFAMPVKVSTLITEGGRVNQQLGVPAYDTNFSAKYYTIGAGFDLLRQLSLSGGRFGLVSGVPPMRFALYASTQDKLGFGSSQLSDHAKAMGEALNPDKTMVDTKGFSYGGFYYLSVGFRYLIYAKPVFIILATGYDLEGAGIINFGGAADTNVDLGYDTNMFYVNHGVSVKIYVSWVGK
ncbi:MAG: hypothetical protein CVT98_04980 [Bacteroidetes bacterium HGW-Bacteroidetes-15]|nr:MAG: hypothetical protein CVT98_04980 [Bacteroidetes bacterium HGW-Bacteroidetes-15]